MIYKIVTAKINNDGSINEGKRRQLISWPVELSVGGLYFLTYGNSGKSRLCRVIEAVKPGI